MKGDFYFFLSVYIFFRISNHWMVIIEISNRLLEMMYVITGLLAWLIDLLCSVDNSSQQKHWKLEINAAFEKRVPVILIPLYLPSRNDKHADSTNGDLVFVLRHCICMKDESEIKTLNLIQWSPEKPINQSIDWSMLRSNLDSLNFFLLFFCLVKIEKNIDAQNLLPWHFWITLDFGYGGFWGVSSWFLQHVPTTF